jgi:dTDP-4-amino-4,6-dideoxygalactose transaminase
MKNIYYKADFIEKAKKITTQVLSLPLYPELKDSEIEYICNCIKEFFL